MHASTSKAYSRREQFQNGCVHSCRLYPCPSSLVFLFTKGRENSTESRRRFERIAHVFRVSFSLSLSLCFAPPSFFIASFYFSRDSHLGQTEGWRGRERERGLVVTRGSHRLHRCWITGALGASIKLHSRGNVGTRAEQIRRQRMNVAGASISRLFRPRVLCPSEMNCACATYTRLRGAVRKLHQL